MPKDQKAPTMGKRAHASHFDIFVLFNFGLLISTTLYAYAKAVWEFGLYAIAILLGGFMLWRWLRRYDFPYWMLIMLQIGIFSHFAGGFLRFDGHALYWHHFAGIRFDKVVHFYNSAVIAMMLTYLYHQAQMRLKPMEGFVVVMATAGLGTMVEMVEYVAVKVLPSTGVGDYANTVEDLIANFLGALFGYVVFRALEARLDKSVRA